MFASAWFGHVDGWSVAGGHLPASSIAIDMVRVNSSQSQNKPLNMKMKYEPPDLPAYLADSFSLKAVIGVPTDEAVKAIHAVIRAVENVSVVPAMCNPALSMELAQHLFDVQMARHRDKFPVNVFTCSNTYTPPTLPSHINVTLGSVIGAPSDDEVKLVRTALRASESLTNIPAMYDPDLSMNLSQHLFDIHFDCPNLFETACHVQQSTEGYYITREPKAEAENIREVELPESPTITTERRRVPVGSPPDIEQPVSRSEEEGIPNAQAPLVECPGVVAGINTLTEKVHDAIEQLKASQEQTDQRLAEGTVASVNTLVEKTHSVIKQLKANQDRNDQRLVEMHDALKDSLENVTRMMVKLHNHSARGHNSANDCIYHHIVNNDGEAPLSYDVPWVTNSSGYFYWDNASESTIARYLLFYGIGKELIELGNSPTLKTGKKSEARKILGRHTHSRPGC
ncbi:hypothetical protein BDV93DRAFT_513888 [Ceratobasidium sp. AG-I]|nr:hypothetical protein BDV93DRAFT_513888 [Ceratobasidium sp. AG-I]